MKRTVFVVTDDKNKYFVDSASEAREDDRVEMYIRPEAMIINPPADSELKQDKG